MSKNWDSLDRNQRLVRVCSSYLQGVLDEVVIIENGWELGIAMVWIAIYMGPLYISMRFEIPCISPSPLSHPLWIKVKYGLGRLGISASANGGPHYMVCAR